MQLVRKFNAAGSVDLLDYKRDRDLLRKHGGKTGEELKAAVNPSASTTWAPSSFRVAELSGNS